MKRADLCSDRGAFYAFFDMTNEPTAGSTGTLDTELAARAAAAAADTIAEGWTQGTDAREPGGAECGPLDDTATCWCSAAAIGKALEEEGVDHPERSPEAALIVQTMGKVIQDRSPGVDGRFKTLGDITVWNDVRRRTADEVQLVMDETARRCQALTGADGASRR